VKAAKVAMAAKVTMAANRPRFLTRVVSLLSSLVQFVRRINGSARRWTPFAG
jgi:hypothetical protein